MSWGGRGVEIFSVLNDFKYLGKLDHLKNYRIDDMSAYSEFVITGLILQTQLFLLFLLSTSVLSLIACHLCLQRILFDLMYQKVFSKGPYSLKVKKYMAS